MRLIDVLLGTTNSRVKFKFDPRMGMGSNVYKNVFTRQTDRQDELTYIGFVKMNFTFSCETYIYSFSFIEEVRDTSVITHWLSSLYDTCKTHVFLTLAYISTASRFLDFTHLLVSPLCKLRKTWKTMYFDATHRSKTFVLFSDPWSQI